MNQIESPVRVSYINPIEKHYQDHTIPNKKKVSSYDNGMFITIDNKSLYFNDLVKDFKDLYVSLIIALTDKKVRKTDLKQIHGDWKGDRIKLPTREKLLGLVDNKIPILVGGVHNYEINDPRSSGKEYCHTHFFVYNTQHYLPTDPKELKDKEDKIERHLSRFINSRTHKRFQGIIQIKPVLDNVSPLQLYDYLLTPITHPEAENLINYISNNRHLPSIQYPLTTIYSNKKP